MLHKLIMSFQVGMILGISGACRREELYNMSVRDIEDRKSFLIVKIPNTKTNIQRTFTVINRDNDINYLEICRKYVSLRPQNPKSEHLFLRYHNGKCSNQVIGKGTIGSWPSKIATFLNLENPNAYTGHSFRRTSATFLANKGVDVLGLKRHGGWRSSTVAESYVEDSLENKLDYAEKILQTTEGSEMHHKMFNSAEVSVNSATTQASGISISNCNNCTFTFNIK